MAVYLCTRPKKAFPSHHELQLRRTPQFSARLDSMTLTVMSPYRYTYHFSLRHMSFNLNREVVEVVWANIVSTTEPVIQHAYTPNDLLVLEVNEGVYPFISNATQIESYAPSGVKLHHHTTWRRKHLRCTLKPQSQCSLPTQSTRPRQL